MVNHQNSSRPCFETALPHAVLKGHKETSCWIMY